MEEKLYDTVEAAEFLGLGRTTVSHFVLKGELPSQKFGRARLIREADLIAFKAIERKPGRPPKPKDEGENETAAPEPKAAATDTPNGQPVTPATAPKAKRKPKAKATQKAAKSKQKAKKAKAS